MLVIGGVRLSPASDLLDQPGVVQEGDEALGHVRVGKSRGSLVPGAGVGQKEQVEKDKEEHHPGRAERQLTMQTACKQSQLRRDMI